MTTSRQRRWSFDTSRWGKYARPSRASRDAAAFSPHVGKNRCKKFGTALGQRRTLEADVPVGGVHLFSGVVRVGHDAHRTRHRRLFAFSASNFLRTGCKMSERKCRHSRASLPSTPIGGGNPAARKSLDPRLAVPRNSPSLVFAGMTSVLFATSSKDVVLRQPRACTDD